MEDVQRPKPIEEAVEAAEKEVKEAVEAVEALSDAVENAKEQVEPDGVPGPEPEPEPESETPTEHWMRKKGIKRNK
jgi:hypothetical protein